MTNEGPNHQPASLGSLIRLLLDPDHQPHLTTTSACRKIAIGIAEGLHYLHIHDVFHGSLCANSVWLDSQYRPKLTDFSIVQYLDHNSADAHMTTAARWWAPERLAAGERGPGQLTRATDIWSLGITLLELYSGGELPFALLADDAVVVKFLVHQRGRPGRPEQCPAADWDSIRACFAFHPDDRCSALDVLVQYEHVAR